LARKITSTALAGLFWPLSPPPYRGRRAFDQLERTGAILPNEIPREPSGLLFGFANLQMRFAMPGGNYARVFGATAA
jgi:hypothetical protein